MQSVSSKLGTYLATASAGLLLLGSASVAQAHHHSKASITDIVLQSGAVGSFDNNRKDFDMLREALVVASAGQPLDLVAALDGGDFTVFAPRDGAFIALAQDLGYTGKDEAGSLEFIVSALTSLSADGNPIPLLVDVLTYHVIGESLKRRQVVKSDSLSMLNGGTISPLGRTLLDNDPDLDNPRILRKGSNIKASNGFIHTIDRVLIPADLPAANDGPTITDIVASSGGDFDRNWLDYDILLNAVLAADLAETLAGGEFTVFAPNDAAFIRLARTLGYRGFRESGAYNFIVAALTDLSGGGDPIPLLTDILLYHVAGGTLTLKDVTESVTITTALEAEPGVFATISPDGLRLEDNAPALRDPRISVFFNEIPASNGIIHTINRVLIPVPIGG